MDILIIKMEISSKDWKLPNTCYNGNKANVTSFF